MPEQRRIEPFESRRGAFSGNGTFRQVIATGPQEITQKSKVVRQAGNILADPGTRGSAERDFRPDIEGLRAVAVLAVVLFHAGVPGLGGGYVGVDVFFVISGFLITGLLWREVSTTGTVRLRRFYGARARRLLPASAAVGVVTMIASALLLPPLQARTVIGDGIASALYVSNYRFILQGVDYFGRRPCRRRRSSITGRWASRSSSTWCGRR